MSIGERLRRARENKKWSTRRLERETERLGRKVSHGYISQLENSERYDTNPSLATIEILARALGLPTSSLLQDEPSGVAEPAAEYRTLPPLLDRAGRLLGVSEFKHDEIISSITKRRLLTAEELSALADDDPDLQIVQKLAYHLNTTMHYLLGRTDDRSPLPGVAVAHHDPKKGVEPGEPMPPETQLIVERAIFAAKEEWGWVKRE